MAITFQGSSFNQGTSSISVTWPTHQTNDVAILLVETENQRTEVTSQDWVFIGEQANGTTRIQMFWCRATSAAMPAVSIAASGNHNLGVILTFRGCVTYGMPYDTTVGFLGTTSSGTTTNYPSATTTKANSMAVMVATDTTDSLSNVTWTGATNSIYGSLNSNSITAYTTQGSGGQMLALYTPTLGVAGSSTGTTTATSSTSLTSAAGMVLLIDAAETPTPGPAYLGDSTVATNTLATSAVTCNYPSGTASGDLLLLFAGFQRGSGSSYTLSTPAGWNVLQTENQGVDSGMVAVLYWRFRGAETSVAVSPSLAACGTMQIHAYRPDTVDATTPIPVTSKAYDTTTLSAAARTLSTLTTTTDNNRVSYFLIIERTSSSGSAMTWNGVETSERTDGYSGTNGDLIYSSATSFKPTAGALPSTTATPGGNSNEMISMAAAIQPVQETFVNGSDTAAATDAVVSQTVTTDASDAAAATDATVSLVTIEDKTGSDAAAATDTVVSVVVPDLAASETAAATDSVVTLQQDHTAADSAAAADATVGVQQDHMAADSAAATDTVDPVAALVDVGDTAAATETGEASNTALGDDTAAATDAIVALDQDHTAGDTSTATDTSVLTGKEMFESESATAVDVVDGDLLAAVDAVDTVAAAEDANASTAVNAPGDSATGTDAAVRVDLIADDQATGLDEAFISDKITATQDDSAVGTDVVESVVALTDSSDSATASDATVLLNQEELGSDTASASDAVVSLVITVEDDLAAVDAPEGTATVLPAQSDSATAVDTGIVGVEAADTATAIEGDAYYIDAATGLNRPRSIRIDPDLRVAAAGSESRSTVIAASSRTAAIVRTATTRRKKITSTDRMVRAER